MLNCPDLLSFEKLPVPVAVVRGDEIVYANGCLGSYLGISVGKLAGGSAEKLFRRVVAAAHAGPEEMSWVRVRNARGEERQVCLRVSPMPGHVDDRIFVLLDTRVESSPRSAEPLASAAEVLAHEVRNPLGAILNAVALLKRESGTVPTADLLAMIEEEAERIDALVSDLLHNVREGARPSSGPSANFVRPSSGSARSR